MLILVNIGCLPFTRAKLSVHGLGKCQGKFGNGKMAFAISVYKSAPPTEKRLRTPKTGIKDGFKEMELENQDYIFRFFVAPK